jgi:hypothetical protein
MDDVAEVIEGFLHEGLGEELGPSVREGVTAAFVYAALDGMPSPFSYVGLC